MADSTKPGLTAVVTPALTDIVSVRQSGDTRDKKETLQQVKDLFANLGQGPGTAIADNQAVRGDTSGVQGSGVTISDAAAVSGVTQLDVDNLRVDGNTIASLDANGDVIVDPNGTGNFLLVSGRLQVGGTTSSFPALKEGGGRLAVRAADDSDWAGLDGTALYLRESGGSTIKIAAEQSLGVGLASDRQFFWVSGAGAGGSGDAGLKRLAVGKIQGTDGGSGALTAFQLTSTVGLFQGTGSPEGVVTAGIGSLYMRTDGGAGTSAYVKESGTGNTGWKALVGV